jgi:hypothetical protein
LQTSQGYIFRILKNFAPKLCISTNFGVLFKRCCYELYYFELCKNVVYYAIGELPGVPCRWDLNRVYSETCWPHQRRTWTRHHDHSHPSHLCLYLDPTIVNRTAIPCQERLSVSWFDESVPWIASPATGLNCTRILMNGCLV